MEFASRISGLIEERFNGNNFKAASVIGISDSLLGSYARGDKVPNMKNSLLLADGFGVSLDYLVGRSEESNIILSPEEMNLVNIYRERLRGTDYFGKLSDFFPEIKKEPALGISENGRELLALYEQLPEREQLLLLGRVQNMVEQSSDTRRVFKAARAKGDGLTDAVVEIQKARMDKIAAAAETEKDL